MWGKLLFFSSFLLREPNFFIIAPSSPAPPIAVGLPRVVMIRIDLNIGRNLLQKLYEPQNILFLLIFAIFRSKCFVISAVSSPPPFDIPVRSRKTEKAEEGEAVKARRVAQ